jgi:hypothetical protein
MEEVKLSLVISEILMPQLRQVASSPVRKKENGWGFRSAMLAGSWSS